MKNILSFDPLILSLRRISLYYCTWSVLKEVSVFSSRLGNSFFSLSKLHVKGNDFGGDKMFRLIFYVNSPEINIVERSPF